jgi:hypothetical protein
MAFGSPVPHFSNKRAIQNSFYHRFCNIEHTCAQFCKLLPHANQKQGVCHLLTKFQTAPRWAWEISIFRLKITFFALIRHRNARFDDF